MKKIKVGRFKVIYNPKDIKFEEGNLNFVHSVIVKKGSELNNFLNLYSKKESEIKSFFEVLKNGNIGYINKWVSENLESDQCIKGQAFQEEYRRYQQSKYNSGNNNQKNRNYQNNGNFSGDYKSLPIFALLEMLSEKDFISFVGDFENNGSETKFKVVINSPSATIKDNLLISAVGRDQYADNHEKANFYSEFKNYFKSSRGSAGEYNLMFDFERLGAFGEPLNQSNYSSEEEYKEALKFKVRPILKDLRKEFFDNDEHKIEIKAAGFKSKVSMPQTLPKKRTFNDKYRDMRELYSIFKSRGFSDKIWKDAIDSGVLSIASNTNPNFGYQNNAIVANMHNIFSPRFPIGAELFSPNKDTGKFIKLFASIGRRLNLDLEHGGSGYIVNVDLSKNKKPKGVVFSEAVLDSLALKDIISYMGEDYKEYSHIGVQGVGNTVNFFKENFGFFYMQDDDVNGDYKKGDIYIVEKEVEKTPIQNELKEDLKNKFKDLKIKYILDESSASSNKQLFKLKKFFEHLELEIPIEIHKVSYATQKVKLDKQKNDGVYIMDQTNVNKFLEENNIEIEYKPKGKTAEYFLRKIKTSERPFDYEKDSLEVLGQRVYDVFKTKKMILGFDNDTAGLKHYEPLKIMFEKIGFDCVGLIPPFHQFGEDNKKLINDNNDVLLFIRYLENLGKFNKNTIQEWVRENFLDLESPMDVQLVRHSLDKAKKISDVEKDRSISSEQKQSILEELLKYKPAASPLKNKPS